MEAGGWRQIREQNSLWYSVGRHAGASVVAKMPVNTAFSPYGGSCVSTWIGPLVHDPGLTSVKAMAPREGFMSNAVRRRLVVSIEHLIDTVGACWYCSPFGRVFRKWRYRIKLYRAILRWWYRAPWGQRHPQKPYHLYEIVISNSRFWFKLQSGCWSRRQAIIFFEHRFNGANFTTPYGYHVVTPFRLSECTDKIDNWKDVLKRLPKGWDEEEYQIEGIPHPWCETLSRGCDCYPSLGNLSSVCCSDFGLSHDTKRSKSENVRYLRYIEELEKRLVQRNEDQLKRVKKSSGALGGAILMGVKPPKDKVDPIRLKRFTTEATKELERLLGQEYYCSIHGLRHAYGEQTIRSAAARIAVDCEQMSAWDSSTALPQMSHLVSHGLERHQADECAQKFATSDLDIPIVLYKYIPKDRIGKGAPNSLRATQVKALNDDMEANIRVMKELGEDPVKYLQVVQAQCKEILGVEVPWHEWLLQAIIRAGPILSPLIQNYLNPLVGVVAFSTDILDPTMWAHYAKNTGIIVGYDTNVLKELGFELKPVIYSELAPVYYPLRNQDILMDFVDRERMDSDFKAGIDIKGSHSILTSAKLTEFGSDWKALARVLFVKGMSWQYEKEVRLLVDLERPRDTGKEKDGYPVKVIDIPPEAIKEIHKGPNTQEAVVNRAVQLARGNDKRGLFVGRLVSNAYRMQSTGGTRY